MATVTLTMNPELVTVPANTDEHEIDFDGLLEDKKGTAYIERSRERNILLFNPDRIKVFISCF